MENRLRPYLTAMLLFIPFSVAPVDDASAEDVGMTCTDNAYDLVELVDCICAHKPPAGSEGYVIPPVAVRDDWRAVVWDMLEITDISVGNRATNVIPARGEARVSIRFNDLHTGKSLSDRVSAIAEKHGGKARPVLASPS